MTTIHHTPINEETTIKPSKKPIELVRYISSCKEYELSNVASTTSCSPSDWNHIRLVIKGNGYEFDVIAAWSDYCDDSPALYLGHWNDGVIG